MQKDGEQVLGPPRSYISGLTPEQLARKRAVDRKSQRGVRERTACYIKTLEAQVTMLSQIAERTNSLQEHIQELSITLQEFKDENARLKAQIGTIPETSSPETLLGRFDMTYHTPPDSNGKAEVRVQQSLGRATSRLGFNLPTISFLLENESDAGTSSNSVAMVNIWQVTPINTEPTCLSDRIFQNFAATSSCADQLIPPADHDISALFFLNDSLKGTHPHPVSQVAMDIISRFSDIAWIPEQIAGYYILTLTLSWRIARNRKFYDLMPTWLRPLPIQLRVPHPYWMDDVPWPRARVFLIENQNSYPFEEFTAYYAPSSTISWPYDPSHVIITTATTSGESEIKMNPIFVQHMNNLRNWTVKGTFEKKYPLLTKLILEDSKMMA